MPWIRCGSALLALAACGIPDGKALIELDAEELGELCEEFVAREVTCTREDGEQTWTFGGACEGASVAATCTATAGDYRDCGEAVAEASDAALCEALPAGCDRFFSEGCVGR